MLVHIYYQGVSITQYRIHLLMVIGGVAALYQMVFGHHIALTIVTALCCLSWFIICTYERVRG